MEVILAIVELTTAVMVVFAGESMPSGRAVSQAGKLLIERSADWLGKFLLIYT